MSLVAAIRMVCLELPVEWTTAYRGIVVPSKFSAMSSQFSWVRDPRSKRFDDVTPEPTWLRLIRCEPRLRQDAIVSLDDDRELRRSDYRPSCIVDHALPYSQYPG